MACDRGDRLESWKEVAAYLERSVRTVRRWEREEGLPVHRHMHQALGRIYASKSELDAWRERADRGPVPAVPPADRASSPRTKAIAVLPFANLSTDAENAYFADGLADEVMATLSKVRALRVTSGTSSRRFRGTTRPASAIAAELGVRYLLEGSVRRAGKRLRVTAKLVDAPSDEQVWADTYDGTIGDVFDFQERLARVIVEALQLRLTADEDERLAERSIEDLAAYECYLRARQEAWRWRKDAIDRAVDLLRSALAIVGDNARLYAALGFAYLQYREAGIDFGDGPLREAEGCARKVFALGEASSAGLQLRGWIRYSRGDVQDAVRDLKAALELEPNNGDTLLVLSNCYLISGRGSAARPLIARLLLVDPLTPVTRCMPAWADLLDGDFAAALAPYRGMLDMDPSNPMARLFYVWVLVLNGRGEAVPELLRGFEPEVRDTVPARLAFLLGHAVAGKRGEAQAELTPRIEAAATATDVFPRIIAQGLALAGAPEPALRWLQVAVERGFINYPFLARHDPFFRPLRGHPELQRLLGIVRERWEKFEA
jgi:TolB-like protein